MTKLAEWKAAIETKGASNPFRRRLQQRLLRLPITVVLRDEVRGVCGGCGRNLSQTSRCVHCDSMYASMTRSFSNSN